MDPFCSTCVLYAGGLPTNIALSSEEFKKLWSLKPATKKSFVYSGRICTLSRSQAPFMSPPLMLGRLRDWAELITGYSYSATLLAFYEEDDHLKAHSDIPSCPGMLVHSPIVSYSFYADEDVKNLRVFRMSPAKYDKDGGKCKTRGKLYDIPMPHNSVIIMSGTAEEHMRHAVPKPPKKLLNAKKDVRRINVTFRSFAH